MNSMPLEESTDYEFDENVEDYSDDVDYEADEVDQRHQYGSQGWTEGQWVAKTGPELRMRVAAHSEDEEVSADASEEEADLREAQEVFPSPPAAQPTPAAAPPSPARCTPATPPLCAGACPSILQCRCQHRRATLQEIAKAPMRGPAVPELEDSDTSFELWSSQDVTGHSNKKFKHDISSKSLNPGLDASELKSRDGGESLADDDEKKDVGVYASLLETKYSDIKSKYEEAQKEITDLKRKKDAAPIVINPDERVKQLEDRVVLIKTKAKERIAEKDAIIEEQNEKLKKFEDILALLEVNCKQAVVKYNDAQVELAKKEEALQLHLSFKNRYDYKLNFLDEKARKMQHDYEIRIRKMEERIANGESARTQQLTEVKKDVKEVKEKFKKAKVTDAKDDVGFAFPKKPKTLRIAKVEPAGVAAIQTESKLPRMVGGVTIKEVLPSNEGTTTVQGGATKESSENDIKTNSEPTLSNDPKESCEGDSKQIVTNLPGVKITLTDAINELDQLAFQEPSLE